MKSYFFYITASLALASAPLSSITPEHSSFLNRAEEFFRDGQNEEARILLEKILDEDHQTPLQQQIRLRLSQLYLSLGRLADAETVIRPFINAATPEGKDALFLSGFIAKKKGEWHLAEELFRQYPGDEGQYQLGIALYHQHRYDEAKDLLLSLQKMSAARLYLARIALKDNDLIQAEQWLSAGEGEEAAYLSGIVNIRRGAYAKAAAYFEQALPKKEKYGTSPVAVEALYLLGKSYLKLTETPFLQLPEQQIYFHRAAQAFEDLVRLAPSDTAYLALAECYLKEGRHLHEEAAYRRAQETLDTPLLAHSKEAAILSTLLKAETAPTYHARDILYRQLMESGNIPPSYYGKELFLKGINDFNEGESFLQKGNPGDAHGYFERAAEGFLKAYDALKDHDTPLALHSIKFVGESRLRQGTQKALIAGILALDTIINDRTLLGKMENPDEIYYLKGTIAGMLAEGSEKEKYFHLAKESLQQGLVAYPQGYFADDILYTIGTLQYKHGDNAGAEASFLKLATEKPSSPLTGDALYWAAMSAEKQNKPKDLVHSYRRRLVEEHPQSPLAAEAYFLYYSYGDYLQGDRAAIKHLQGMRSSYPNSPYLLNAYYLIGLDYKRDRKTPEGKWIRKRNLTAAIDAFNEVESLYDYFLKTGQISDERRYPFLFVRYRATLERALANLSIANESLGAKREIYLEYAEEVFQEIIYDLQEPGHPLATSSIQEEAMHWLIQTYLEAGREGDADAIAVALLEKYTAAKTTRGYYLSRLWTQRGIGALRRGDAVLALNYYNKAEETGRGKVLSVDQKLDLWIQQSAAFLALEKYDEAMLLLSKVINEDAVSGLRLKAMFLRAEVYEKQGRRELARKQLEATMKKGGEWAVKAKQKLEEEYAK